MDCGWFLQMDARIHSWRGERRINDGVPMKQAIDAQIVAVLQSFPQLKLAVLFGSIASGRQRPDSDLDIAKA